MTLRVTDLAISRGGALLVEGLSFALAAGQAMALRGPNGIGKTTLLRSLAGLQPPVRGAIDGAADRIAYAGHADGIKGTLTASENLQFWAGVFGTFDIDMALAAFRLEHLADRPAGEFSAGQKRRLGLARLLVTGRPVWLLDEPTVSLDIEAVGWFAEAVTAHLTEGGSALIATHVELGLETETLDLAPFRARAPVQDDFL